MRNPALRVFEQAARRAHGRTYSRRAVSVARSWQFPDGALRLVPSPVFVLTTLRSGSDLLRTVLDRHSRICAPPELHLGSWRVETSSTAARAALDTAGLTDEELADLLWDRVLHLQLVRTGKSVIVDKTPRNALLWKRIYAHWPDARFLVLTRHPAHVVDDLAAARPEIAIERHRAEFERYAIAIDEARHVLSNVLTVRHEDLRSQLTETTQVITSWLGVPWEAAMLGYARTEPTGLSRWRRPAVTGPVRLALPVGANLPEPQDIPPGLERSCELLGYA